MNLIWKIYKFLLKFWIFVILNKVNVVVLNGFDPFTLCFSPLNEVIKPFLGEFLII